MSSMVTAVVGSAVVGAWASNKASKSSERAINKSTDAQLQLGREQMDEQARLSKPWIEAGLYAQGNMDNPNENFQKSFDYDWRRSEGQRDLNNLMSVRGGGGNTIRAAIDYNQNAAGQEFGNWWNRQDRVATRGQAAAAGQAANMGQAYGNMGNAYANQGNMLAQNAWNRYSGINNSVQSGLGNMMYMAGNQIGPKSAPWMKG